MPPAVTPSVCRRLDGSSTEAAVNAVITAQALAGYYLASSVYGASWLWLFFNPSG